MQAPSLCPERRSKEPHIVFLTPQVPYPPEQGTALRNYHLLRCVAEHYRISLLTFTESPSPLPPELRNLCQVCVAIPAPPPRGTAERVMDLVSESMPDMAQRLRSPAFERALFDMLNATSADLVQVEGLELGQWAVALRQRLGSAGPLLVFDDHNAEYILQRRAMATDLGDPSRWAAAAYSSIQARRLARFERQVCLSADAVIAVSEGDAQALRRLSPNVNPVVVPNGVDIVRYRPGLADSLHLQHPAVVFTGKMDYRPNVDAVLWLYREVWPIVRARVPEAHLYIVGKDPHPRLNALQHDPTVTVTGYVEDDLPYFGGADVYVAPLRVGGGTRLKILQALAAGLPLVSTTLGVEGIEIRHGEHALLADQSREFAEATISLILDRNLAKRLAMAGRSLVAAQYSWEGLIPRLLSLYEALGI